ncbi:hypothetical protein QJQ45_012463 [Haematococcus lacustris]|nr:hypothetical protein QJQ45_012463 [Haematococcus lacustris]
MPASVSRNTLLQATTLMSIVGRKTVYASVLGALFTFTEAFLENTRGHDTYNGIAAGALTGAFFGLVPMRPMPQPIAWPLAFAAAAGVADIFGEFFPATMQTTRSYGPLETRPGWGDPAPPRPPIVSSGVPPNSRGHFTQGE